MDINGIIQIAKDVLKPIGESVSGVTQTLLSWLSEQGFISSPTSAKLVSILVILIFSYFALHFITSLKKPIRWGIIAITILLVLSVVITLFNGN